MPQSNQVTRLLSELRRLQNELQFRDVAQQQDYETEKERGYEQGLREGKEQALCSVLAFNSILEAICHKGSKQISDKIESICRDVFSRLLHSLSSEPSFLIEIIEEEIRKRHSPEQEIVIELNSNTTIAKSLETIGNISVRRNEKLAKHAAILYIGCEQFLFSIEHYLTEFDSKLITHLEDYKTWLQQNIIAQLTQNGLPQ